MDTNEKENLFQNLKGLLQTASKKVVVIHYKDILCAVIAEDGFTKNNNV